MADDREHQVRENDFEAGREDDGETGQNDRGTAKGIHATRDVLNREVEQIAAAYEAARKELVHAVGSLRQEMERIDLQRARSSARGWVEENPALSVFLAAGAGVLVGRGLSAAMEPAPPPPLRERARAQGRAWAEKARESAREAGEQASRQARTAGKTVERQAQEAGRRAREQAQTLGERIAPFVAEASHRTTDFSKALSERVKELQEATAQEAAEIPALADEFLQAMQERTQDVAGSVRNKASRGMDVMESVGGAMKTILTAVLVKKAVDLLRRP